VLQTRKKEVLLHRKQEIIAIMILSKASTCSIRQRMEVWDRRSAPAHPEAICQWATFLPFRPKHGTRDDVAARMCTYPVCSDRYVSSMIQTCGRWYDCDTLVTLWNAVESDKGSKSIYIEIGANIGSCVMQMLFSTNASNCGI
jgi:hypothetical protein